MVLASKMEITITRMPSVLLMSLVPCMLLLATSAILTAASNDQTVDEWLWRAVDDSLRAADEIPVLRLRSGIELPSFDGGLRLV